jgi:hypothetical protein
MIVKDLVKYEKPCILLIQKTKMKVEDVTKLWKILWHSSEAIVVDARGASGGLCTLWDDKEVSMEHHFKTHHWIFTKFKHRKSNNLFAIFNVICQITLQRKLSARTLC